MRAILWLLIAVPLAAQTRRTTDAESVAGICRQDQTDARDAEMRQLLAGEVNAVAEGFFRVAPMKSSSRTAMMATRPCRPSPSIRRRSS